jgi:hypothetical protein
MTHQSTDPTYLAGYDQGRQDGSRPSSNEAEADMQPPTGNQRTDDGYVDGFHHGREMQRRQAVGQWAISLARTVRLHRLAHWLGERQPNVGPAGPRDPAANV